MFCADFFKGKVMRKKPSHLLIMTTMLLSSLDMFAFSAKPRSGNSSQSTPGTTVENTKVTPASQTVYSGASVTKTCGSNVDKEEFYPQSLLKLMTMNQKDAIKVTVDQKNKKISVKLIDMYKGCGSFKPVMTDSAEGKISISVVLEEKSKNKTFKDLKECLENKKVLVNEEIDHTKTTDEDYETSESVFNYDTPKNNKSLKLVYAHPQSYQSGLKQIFKIPDTKIDDSIKLNDCKLAEKLDPESTLLYKGTSEMIDEIKKICESGDAQKIAEAINSLGNFEQLSQITDDLKTALNVAYVDAIAKKNKASFERMSELNRELSNSNLTEEEAQSKMTEFRKEVEAYNRDYLDNALVSLNDLVQRARAMDKKDPARKGLDDQILSLNKEIGDFNTRVSRMTGVGEAVKKYALIDDGRFIEDIRLRSQVFSSVYPSDSLPFGRTKALSFKDAERLRERGLELFDKKSEIISDAYGAGRGDVAPFRKYVAQYRKANSELEKFYKKIQEEETALFKKHCQGFFVNQNTCNQKFYVGRERRILIAERKAAVLSNRVTQAQSKATAIGNIYENYKNKTREERENRGVASFESNGILGSMDSLIDSDDRDVSDPSWALNPVDEALSDYAGSRTSINNPSLSLMPQQNFQQNWSNLPR